jgi:aminoglycoside phosphotransferase (APT) family kinase protein
MPVPEPRIVASGRDSDIYEHGPDRVLRRARDGRSLEAEAEVMRHLSESGYPVPRVWDAHGPDLVMDLVRGPTMLEALSRRPWTFRRHADTIADLHERLHRVPPPEGLPEVAGGGPAVLHLDLHPMNVILSPNGPVVIDWPNARRGPAEVDMAMTWVIVGCSVVPGSAPRRALAGLLRRRFLEAFLSHFDRAAIEAYLPPVVDGRIRDRNVLPAEIEAMHRLVQK